MKATSYILIDYKHQTVEFSLSMRVFREDDYFFAECPELRQIDQGKSPREAADNLIHMIQASILEAIMTSNIDKMLQYLGFSKGKMVLPNRKIYNQHIDAYDELLPLSFDVPIPVSREFLTAV
jgi:predicted RNase H-like HicB family nuclease